MIAGALSLPVGLMIASTPSRSLTLRCTIISRSSLKPISPRSNIQCAVPERARPLRTLSGPPCSTGRICAACASRRPPPLISFNHSPRSDVRASRHGGMLRQSWLLRFSETIARRGKLIRRGSVSSPEGCECSANVSVGRVAMRRLI